MAPGLTIAARWHPPHWASIEAAAEAAVARFLASAARRPAMRSVGMNGDTRHGHARRRLHTSQLGGRGGDSRQIAAVDRFVYERDLEKMVPHLGNLCWARARHLSAFPRSERDNAMGPGCAREDHGKGS